MENRPLTVSEAARIADVVPETVRRAIRAGRLAAWRTPGKYWMIEAQAFGAWLAKRRGAPDG